jgi:cyclophilin family peptidyl-prolyl cis-trans isomerase
MLQFVIETTCFVDPHGTPEEGGQQAFITKTDYMSKDGQYTWGGEIVDEDNLQGSEDGYNATCEYYDVTQVTLEEAISAAEVIEAYAKLTGQELHSRHISARKLRDQLKP